MAEYKGLEPLLQRVERQLATAFGQLALEMRANVDLDELESLIATGRSDDAIERVVARMDGFGNESVSIYLAAGHDVARHLSSQVGFTVRFDQVNELALRQMQRASLDFVRDLQFNQRQALRAALVSSVERGLNPKDTAREFRDAIGLNRRAVAAVQNYRRLLETGSREALTRALRDKRFDPTVRAGAATPAQIDRMVDAYRRKMLTHRAQNVGLTEALRAVHRGADEGFRQATNAGIIEAGSLERTWRTAGDERRRDSHRAMEGQLRGVGVPFISGAGNRLLYPGDPTAPASDTIRCRCVVTYTYVLVPTPVAA